MLDSSHVNRVLAENCENCRVTVNQYDDGSSNTRFSYEFCLHPTATSYVGETPLFSTGRTDVKLDWRLKFGPGFRANLHLRRWEGCDDFKVHIICCWKLPSLEDRCVAINENLDHSVHLPTCWSVELPIIPGVGYGEDGIEYDSKLILDISLVHRVNDRRKHLRQFLASSLEDGRFSDVTLVAGFGRLQAHRVILSQRWPGILKGQNDTADCLHLRIDPGILKMILEFLYTGRLVNVEEWRLEALLANALESHLTDLQNLCEDLIRRRHMQESRPAITIARHKNNFITQSAELL